MKRIAILSVFLIVCCGALTFSDFIAAERVRVTTVITSETTVSKAKKEEETTKVVSGKKETTTKVVVTTEATTVEKTTAKPRPKPKPKSKPSYDVDANVDNNHYLPKNFLVMGEYEDSSGYVFKYYPQEVLPGEGLKIPGRHLSEDGYVCDESGNICLASTNLPKGTVVKIPFGDGIGVVYDECKCEGKILDVYLSRDYIIYN